MRFKNKLVNEKRHTLNIIYVVGHLVRYHCCLACRSLYDLLCLVSSLLYDFGCFSTIYSYKILKITEDKTKIDWRTLYEHLYFVINAVSNLQYLRCCHASFLLGQFI